MAGKSVAVTFYHEKWVAVVIAAAAVQDQGGDHRDQEREHVEA